jgi:hypothetical protein
VRTELRRFVLELASRYPIDGVHLDYIRYPTGWAPPGGERAVTRLVELLRYDLRTVRSSALLSAAVMPRPAEALRSFAQHWEAWLAGGLVDEVVPMVYRDTPDAVVDVVRDYPASVERGRVWVGVRIDRLDPDEYRETAERLGDDGVAGAVLFSHNLIAEDPRWRGVDRVSDVTRSREIQASFSTLPARMQLAQTRIRRATPPTRARTVWRLGSNRRRVLLLAWLTRFPDCGALPQMVQTWDILLSRAIVWKIRNPRRDHEVTAPLRGRQGATTSRVTTSRGLD